MKVLFKQKGYTEKLLD